MYKLFLIALVIDASLAATSLWGQCGGEGFTGQVVGFKRIEHLLEF